MPESVLAGPQEQLANFTVTVTVKLAHQTHIVSPGGHDRFLREGFNFLDQDNEPFGALLVCRCSPLGEVGGVNHGVRMSR